MGLVMPQAAQKCVTRRLALIALLVAAIAGSAASCAALVPLDVDEYVPALRGDFGRYRGQSLYLAGISLLTDDASQHRYLSRDGKFIFEPVTADYTKWINDPVTTPRFSQAPPLDIQRGLVHENIPYLNYYLWNCVAKALQAVGITVHAEPPPSYAGPMLRVIVRTIDDQNLVAQAKLTRPAPAFEQTYSIHEEPPPPNNRTADTMARKSYTLINRFVEELLSDPDFQKAVVSAQ
jgi:hypothetical protein